MEKAIFLISYKTVEERETERENAREIENDPAESVLASRQIIN